MSELTPREIVKELNRYIIGQDAAKKAVAIALRNRWRRLQLDEALREEVLPKNILMIGPTGVGKTEISRRLAKLTNSPFIKIEATKFTEVGYVGRDVEQIIRDLVEIAINQTREAYRQQVQETAEEHAIEALLDALVGNEASSETRSKFRKKLLAGDLDDKDVEIEINEGGGQNYPMFDIPGMPGAQMGMINLSDMFGKMAGPRKKKIMLKVEEALPVLIEEECEKLIDQDKIVREAIENVEEKGIVFLDEVDKICARGEQRSGGDISREGVQRDLLPLIEGTTVTTKHGMVQTDHILFVASGAFHLTKPSDLLPELQGRLPIRVELNALKEEDFIRILTEPEASLIKQSVALMKVEGVTLNFKPEGIKELAQLAVKINNDIENIGARRLHTVLEKTLEEISFEASEQNGQTLVIDATYIQERVKPLMQKSDLGKFIL